MATNQDAGASPQADSRYLIIVGELLLVIIGSLAALWMMERNRRITAENDLVIKDADPPVFDRVTRTIKKGVAPARARIIE